MLEELKPCPFCGGKPVAIKNGPYTCGFKFYIICKKCGIRSPKYYKMEFSLNDKDELKIERDDREEAVKDWNRLVNEKEIGR